jgi:hypothetical protein
MDSLARIGEAFSNRSMKNVVALPSTNLGIQLGPEVKL